MVYLCSIYTTTMKHNRSLSIIKDRKAKRFFALGSFIVVSVALGFMFLNSQQSRATIPSGSKQIEVGQLPHYQNELITKTAESKELFFWPSTTALMMIGGGILLFIILIVIIVIKSKRNKKTVQFKKR